MNAHTDELRAHHPRSAMPHEPDDAGALGSLFPFLLCHTVSSALVALENHAELVTLLGSTPEKLRQVQQATLAAQTLQRLIELAHHHGEWVNTEITAPPWRVMREHFGRAARKHDLCACLIIQDLMNATLARVLYQGFGRVTHPNIQALGDRLMQTQAAHWMAGINPLQAMLAINPDLAHDSLVWAHQRVMVPWMAQIESEADWPTRRPAVGAHEALWLTELARLGHEARSAYAAALDTVGFDARVTKPLIASLSQTPRSH